MWILVWIYRGWDIGVYAICVVLVIKNIRKIIFGESFGGLYIQEVSTDRLIPDVTNIFKPTSNTVTTFRDDVLRLNLFHTIFIVEGRP